jgi:hypothetical protein
LGKRLASQFHASKLVSETGGTIAEYIEKFEDLRHQLLLHDPSTSSVFFVAHFLEGLKEEIRSVIAIHGPQDMDTVCTLALQEEETKGVKCKPTLKSDNIAGRTNWRAAQNADRVKDQRKANDTSQKGEDKVSSLLSYRKAKGLCYKCGEKWGKGHTCPA